MQSTVGGLWCCEGPGHAIDVGKSTPDGVPLFGSHIVAIVGVLVIRSHLSHHGRLQQSALSPVIVPVFFPVGLFASGFRLKSLWWGGEDVL